jgi:DNA-binding transcriptional MerR regulator
VTRWEMAFAIVSGLLVNECCDISPWVAVRLMRWATRLRYRGAGERAAVRGEELAALILDRPGNLFKLLTAIGFTLHALLVPALRSAPPVVKRAEVAAQGQARQLEPRYRGPTVTKLVGISYRQLDYWARTGLVKPSVRAAEGSGMQGLYSFKDVVELRIIKRLLDANVTLRQIRTALSYLRKESGGKLLTDVTLISDAAATPATRGRRSSTSSPTARRCPPSPSGGCGPTPRATWPISPYRTVELTDIPAAERSLLSRQRVPEP